MCHVELLIKFFHSVRISAERFVLKALVYCYMSGDSRRQSDEQIPHHIWAFHMILLMPKLYQFIRVNLLYQQGLTSTSKWKVFLWNWEKIPFLNGPKLLQSKSPEMTANTGLISTTKELVTSYLPISLNLLAICNKRRESYNSQILFTFYLNKFKNSFCFFLDFLATSSFECYVFHRSTLVSSLFHAVISFLAKLFVLSSKQTVFNFIIKLSTN